MEKQKNSKKPSIGFSILPKRNYFLGPQRREKNVYVRTKMYTLLYTQNGSTSTKIGCRIQISITFKDLNGITNPKNPILGFWDLGFWELLRCIQKICIRFLFERRNASNEHCW